MNILDIFKEQEIERVEPVTGRTGLMGDNVELAPSVSDLTPDPELGEITDAKFGWKQNLIDQSVPSKEFFTPEILLAQILDAVRKEQQLSVAGDFTRTVNLNVLAQTASAGKQVIQVYDIGQFGHVYIPPDPNSAITSFRIYKGLATTDLLWAGSHSVPVSMKIPGVDTLTIQFDSDITTATTFQLYLSVRPFLLSNPAAAGYANQFPPYVTGWWYDSSYGFSSSNSNIILAPAQVYFSPLWFPRDLTVDQVSINVTTASATGGDTAVVAIYESSTVREYAIATLADRIGGLVSAVSPPLATDVIAAPTAAFPYTFKGNKLYLSAIMNNLNTVALRGVVNVQGWGKTTALQSSDVASFRIAGVYPTMPANPTGPVTASNTGPGIMFRAV